MEFKKYPKIQALHKEECDGILNGAVVIQEKIDGANASIFLGTDGIVHCGSRSRDLTLENDSFNGFLEYVNTHEGIQSYFKENPSMRLYGEWLVRHTLAYNELSYKNFYLYEIEDELGNTLPIEKIYEIGEQYGIKTAHLFGVFTDPDVETINNMVGNSVIGEKGEGVVIKNLDFVNKFGYKQHAKIVTQEFKEENATTFGGNNKTSEVYNETYYVNKFVTLSRVQKTVNKISSSEERPDMKHIPMVMGMVFYDVITEEAFVIAKEMAKSGAMFDFKSFKRLCDNKTKKIFIEIITGDISVAHKQDE